MLVPDELRNNEINYILITSGITGNKRVENQ